MKKENYDEMELGDTGWVPMPNGSYKNIYNNHYIDDLGREFDEHGTLIFSPDNLKE